MAIPSAIGVFARAPVHPAQEHQGHSPTFGVFLLVEARLNYNADESDGCSMLFPMRRAALTQVWLLFVAGTLFHAGSSIAVRSDRVGCADQPTTLVAANQSFSPGSLCLPMEAIPPDMDPKWESGPTSRSGGSESVDRSADVKAKRRSFVAPDVWIAASPSGFHRLPRVALRI